MRQYGIPVPEGIFTNNPVLAAEFVEEQGESVVKAQTLAGKRSKAGGIKFVSKYEQGELATEVILESKLYDEEIIGVLVEKKIDIEDEFYLSFYYDTVQRSPVLVFSKYGGVEIEERVKGVEDGLNSLSLPIGINAGWKIRNFLSKVVGDDRKLVELVRKIYQFFLDYDFQMIEINPLAKSKDGDYYVIDVVSIFDISAWRRHPEIHTIPRGIQSQTLSEGEFKADLLNLENIRGIRRDFILFDGDIAVLTFGGSLSLVVIDYIYELGGKPYNYIELRGTITSGKIYRTLKRLLASEKIKGLLIMGATLEDVRIEVVATGIVRALKDLHPRYPIIVRIAGPIEDVAKDILKGLRGLKLKVFHGDTSIKDCVREMVGEVYGNSY